MKALKRIKTHSGGNLLAIYYNKYVPVGNNKICILLLDISTVKMKAPHPSVKL